MGKTLIVSALAAGFYGQFRNPGDKFAIAKISDFSKKWMLPENFSISNGKATAKKASETEEDEEAAELAAELLAQQAAKGSDENGEASEGDDELKTFSQYKEAYPGQDGVEIDGSEAVQSAFEDFEGSVEAWNDLTQKDRRDRVLAKVSAMIADAEDEE